MALCEEDSAEALGPHDSEVNDFTLEPSMVVPRSAILRRSSFWWTLGTLNAVFSFLQPVVLVASVLLVAIIYGKGAFQGVGRSGWFRVAMKCLGIYVAWCATLLIIGVPFVSFEALATDKLTGGIIVGLNCALWAGTYLWWKTRPGRLAKAARIEQSVASELRRKQDEQSHQTRQSAQRRRDDERARCELYFALHGPEIGNRFPRSMFDDFVSRYMGDSRTPDEVHERGTQLLGILEHHRNRVEPNEKSLETIIETFEERKRRVRAASIDAQDQELLLMQLDTQREEAIRRAMAEGTL